MTARTTKPCDRHADEMSLDESEKGGDSMQNMNPKPVASTSTD